MTRTTALLSIAVGCGVALVMPVVLGRDARFSVTDPTALMLLGALCVALGTNIFRK